jgi:hypothetical protein
LQFSQISAPPVAVIPTGGAGKRRYSGKKEMIMPESKILTIVLLLLASVAFGQQKRASSRYNIDKVIVTLQGKEFRGRILSADSASLVMYGYVSQLRRSDSVKIPYSLISNIRVRVRGTVGLGIVIGGLVGGLMGYSLANNSSDGFMKDASIGAGAILGTALGATLGGASVGARKKYQINGDSVKYNAFLQMIDLKYPQ